MLARAIFRSCWEFLQVCGHTLTGHGRIENSKKCNLNIRAAKLSLISNLQTNRAHTKLSPNTS